jgi:hypothetical protein
LGLTIERGLLCPVFAVLAGRRGKPHSSCGIFLYLHG